MTQPAMQRSLPAVFVNGEQMPEGSSTLSPRDRGLTLADGLFETMRVRGGTVFRLEHHLARLSEGLRIMAIAEPADLRRWLGQALDHAGADDASLQLTVTRGPGPGGLAPPAIARPTAVIVIAPMPAVHPD